MLEANRDSICRIIKKDIDMYFELEVQVEDKRYRYYIVENDFSIRELSLIRWFKNIIKEYSKTENFKIRKLKTNILYDFNILSLRNILTDKEIFEIMLNLIEFYNTYELEIKDRIKIIFILKTKEIDLIKENLKENYFFDFLKEEIENFKLFYSCSKKEILKNKNLFNKYTINDIKYSGYSYFNENQINHFYIIKDLKN